MVVCGTFCGEFVFLALLTLVVIACPWPELGAVKKTRKTLMAQ